LEVLSWRLGGELAQTGTGCILYLLADNSFSVQSTSKADHDGLRFRKPRGLAYGILKSGFEQMDSRVSFSFRNTGHFLCSLYFGTKMFSMEKWYIR